MEMELGADLQTQTMAGGLKELVMKWFNETQAPLIQNNGNFPDWFQGFATRKDTEELLRDKALGCFLIRLSDKALGYILSYKGHDRCRHFVITQNRDEQFIISGDGQPYHSLTELIEHYKVSPIQPFGEYLTSSYYKVDTDDLYDVVNFNSKGSSGVSVQALRTLWDQNQGHCSKPAAHPSVQHRQDMPPPLLPPKNQAKNRKLMGTVSVDATSVSQSTPPVPKRGFPPSFLASGSLPETTQHPNETKLWGIKSPSRMPDRNSLSTTDAPDFLHSEPVQVEIRSKSLTHLNNNKVEDKYSNQLSDTTTSKSCSPSLVKRVTCYTYSLHEPRPLNMGVPSLEQQSDDLEMLTANPLYQTSEGPGKYSGQQAEEMYAEVPQSSTPAGLPDNTYEHIPRQSTGDAQSNTYESLDEMKSKKPKSTWGKSNIKWKFLPDYKKK